MRFTSQQVELPTADRFFPEGPGAEAANNNCLTCHFGRDGADPAQVVEGAVDRDRQQDGPRLQGTD